jgi:hypothetical protein
MGDPQRLLGLTNESDELERELLGSLRDVSPRPGAKGEAWNRLVLPAAAVATIGTGSAVVHAVGRTGAVAALQATKVLTAKVVMGVALAGSTAIGGGWWLHQRSVAPPIVRVAGERVAIPAAPIAPVPSFEATEPAPLAITTPPRAPDRPAKVVEDGRPRANLLSLESRMLTDARAELHRGDPRAALATLERLRARSPKGTLTQERDVLTIQILSALGEAATANRKAKEFLDAYPESPHAPQLRRLLGNP